MRGNLFIVSAPSGTGKGRLVGALLDQVPNLKLSVSHTTRAPRPGEVNGRDYYFVDHAEFARIEEAGEFLEHATYQSNGYGTTRAFVESNLSAGTDVVLEIEVQGAGLVKREMPEAIAIFLMPPSRMELERRLRDRATNSDGDIARRMAIAEAELPCYRDYDYVIINDRFEDAVTDLVAIVRANGKTLERQTERAEAVIQTFGGSL